MGIETILGAVSLGASALGTVGSVIGAQQQAKAQESAAKYQAQVAANNAAIADQQALKQAQANDQAAQQQGYRTADLVGRQRAALAAAGVDVNSGTPLMDQETSYMIGRTDVLQQMQAGDQQTQAFRNQATNYRNQSTLATQTAQNAREAGGIATTNALLSGASSFSNKWAGLQRTGAIPSFSDMIG